MPTTVNNSQNTVTITDNNANLEITDNNTGNVVDVTGVDISTVTISDVGPKGDKGDPGEYVSGSSPDFGNINASGNISSSGGTITAGQFVVDGKLSHANDPDTEVGFSSDTITLRANNQQQGRFGANNLQLGNPSNPSPVFITASTIDVVGTVSSLNVTTLNLGSGGILLPNQGPSVSEDSSFSVRQVPENNEDLIGAQNYNMSITGDITMGGNLNLSGSHNRGHVTASGNMTVNGKVVIGSDSPTEKLSVGGNVSATGTGSFSDGRFTGKVGIGTTSPDSDIEIESTNAHAQINIDSARDASLILDKGAATRRAAIIYKTAGTNNWFVGSADSDVVGVGDDYFIGKTVGGTSAEFFISSSGNVGIGTTAPIKKLDIAGGDIRLDNSKGIFFATNDGNIGRVSITGDESSDFIQLKVDNNNNHLLRLNTTGVGIGTATPVQKLHVVGNISASGDIFAGDSVNEGLILTSPNGTKFRLRVDDSGNLSAGSI